jgi:hypothetical protein
VGDNTSGGVGPWRQPQNNWVELMEPKVACVPKSVRLAVLVRDISKAMVDLGMPLISGIPQDLSRASDILEVAGTVLDCLWRPMPPVLVPRIRRHQVHHCCALQPSHFSSLFCMYVYI